MSALINAARLASVLFAFIYTVNVCTLTHTYIKALKRKRSPLCTRVYMGISNASAVYIGILARPIWFCLILLHSKILYTLGKREPIMQLEG